MITAQAILRRYQHSLRSHGLRKAIALQAIEDNPLSDEEIALLESFERRGLSEAERDAAIARWIEEKYGTRAR